MLLLFLASVSGVHGLIIGPIPCRYVYVYACVFVCVCVCVCIYVLEGDCCAFVMM